MPEVQQEGEGRRVLIVDDDGATLNVLDLALTKRGYEVQTTTSAAEGLNHLDREIFHAVIADIVMPEMDGFAFLAQVRERPATATIPFIFLTGDRTVPSKVKGLDLGVDEYITKPCVIEELYARLAAMIRRRDAHTAHTAAAGAPSEGWDLTGNLVAMPFTEILQAMNQNRKTGVLRLNTRFGMGEVYLQTGEVHHATFAGIADGPEAVYLIGACDEGTFDFRGGVQPPVRTVNSTVMALLLEASRQKDTTQALLRAAAARTQT
jgi:DNA-binding response OmpR family regulator